MKYQLTKLKNGIRLLTVPLPSLESVTITVWIKVGSRFEPRKIGGISHFLEHMAFKGSKKRPTPREISSIIDGIGGAFNAGTSREWTNFYIKTRAELAETAFDVLSDMLLNPILDVEEIVRERGVILEEIAMKEDTPMNKIADLFTGLLFEGSNLGNDVIGTPESIKAISKDDFVTYRKTHYGGENMVITVAGGVKEKEILSLSNKYFSGFPQKKGKIPTKFASKQQKPKVLLESKKSEQAHLILGFRAYERVHKDRFALAVLSTILGSGMSSRLFYEIRDKRGLAYAVNSSISHYVDTGLFAVYAGVVVKKVDEAIKVIIDQNYGLADGDYPIKKSELTKAKEFIKGRNTLALEDTRNVNDLFGLNVLFLPRILTPAEIFEKIDKVTINDVYRVAKDIFNPKLVNLTLIGPYKSKARFEKLLT